MIEWKRVKLSELGEIVGGATPSTSHEAYYNGHIPWLTPKDLAGYTSRYIKSGERNITKEGLDSCSAKMMPKNTVLFSSRAPIGYIAIAENDICTNQGFKSIVPNENIDPLFLYYLLKFNRDRIEAMGSGTTFKEVSRKTMGNVTVNIPVEKAIQRKIAAILDGLDSKIELNNKINDNLQQQAQAIYAAMFIDNPELETTSGTLSDIATITMGQSPSGSSYNENGIGEVFYQGRAEFDFRFPTRRLFTTEPKRIAEAGDVLLSVRAPVSDLNVAYERCCIGRGLGALHSKDGNNSFLLYTMFALKPQLDVFNGEGTVFGSINRAALNAMPVEIPSTDEIARFEAIVHPMDALIRVNYEEICRLQTMRDSLLPRLMSGEIDVSAIQL
ncbi:Putative type I restriction enzyme specificity protein MPN_638 [uncultured Flavonifractor sp.]|nr:Putative type I restriction enzyme specificity protein MPN_638 [uncultured Flavonifractor sp.]